MVVGTNGVKITENLARILQREGVRGLSLSLDALDAERHDAFRRVRGAWQNTVEGAKILARVGPAVHRPDDGRRAQRRRARRDRRLRRTTSSAPRSGTSTSSCRPGAARTSSDLDAERVRPRPRRARRHPARVRRPHAGQRQVRAALRARPAEQGPDLAVSRRATPAAPAAVRRARTTWASARTATSRRARTCRSSAATSSRRACATSGTDSDLFVRIRQRTALGGRCGACELNPAVRRLSRPRLRHDRRRHGRGPALHPHSRAPCARRRPRSSTAASAAGHAAVGRRARRSA